MHLVHSEVILYMWRANSPTLAATVVILVQCGLLMDRPHRAPMRGVDIWPSPPQHLQPTHGPRGSASSTRSSKAGRPTSGAAGIRPHPTRASCAAAPRTHNRHVHCHSHLSWKDRQLLDVLSGVVCALPETGCCHERPPSNLTCEGDSSPSRRTTSHKGRETGHGTAGNVSMSGCHK